MITEKQFIEAQKIVEVYKLQLQQPPITRIGRWKCMLCGRDKFTHKSPHKCVGGYRKRNDGIIYNEMTDGVYWSSTISNNTYGVPAGGEHRSNTAFNGYFISLGNSSGNSVRCIKN